MWEKHLGKYVRKRAPDKAHIEVSEGFSLWVHTLPNCSYLIGLNRVVLFQGLYKCVAFFTVIQLLHQSC